jgi:uncharacterized protein YkwD
MAVGKGMGRLSPRARLCRLLLSSSLLCAACATEQQSRWGDDSDEGRALPAWFRAPEGLAKSPELEEAAALLCARDTDAVIDEDVRAATGLYDGQVSARLERGAKVSAQRTLVLDLPALVDEVSATHFGFAEGRTPEGVYCAAVVVVRRQLDLETPLPTRLDAPEAFPLKGALTAPLERARVYLLRPEGGVERSEEIDGPLAEVIDLRAGEGRYVLEVVALGADDDPQVALLWPFLVGERRLPPIPRVLFPDEGHGDLALTRRAEALVHRLRTEMEIDTLAFAPALSRVARARAEALAEAGRLGHRAPGTSAHEQLRSDEPGFPVKRLAEVQAQAGTLEEAWGALLASPAHRYELVTLRASHAGVAVVRGSDAFERDLITLVVLSARRIQLRPPDHVRTELMGRLNLARNAQGRPPLKLDKRLQAAAQAHAERLTQSGALDDDAGGRPLSEVALDQAKDLSDVRSVVARVDDPLRISPSGATLDGAASVVGVGLVPPEVAGQWVVCVLVGTAD